MFVSCVSALCRWLVGLALVSLAALAFGARAQAAGTLMPSGVALYPGIEPLAGPVFAGSAVAWAAPVRGGIGVFVSGPGGPVTQRLAVPDSDQVAMELSGSAQALAFAIQVDRCAGFAHCKYMDYYVQYSHTFGGLTGQPLSSLGCGSSLGVGSGVPFESVDVSRTAVATLDGCANRVTVRDLATPGVAAHVFAGDQRVRIAGSYLAVGTSGAAFGREGGERDTITVYDWLSGRELYRVDAPSVGPPMFDIQDDGTLAFVRGSPATSYEVAVASPQQPAPRTLTSLYAFDMRIAQSKIAVREEGQFRVFDLAGNQLAATSSHEGRGSLDFDGTRLLYALQPCEVRYVVTWDLQGSAPAPPAGRCPAARADTRRVTIDVRHPRFSLRVHCPSMPALGCGSLVAAKLISRAGLGEFTRTQGLTLESGETRVLRFSLSRPQRCELQEHRIAKILVDLRPDTTYASRAAARGLKPLMLRPRLRGHLAKCH